MTKVLESLQKKWEKAFGKKMTKNERVMFRWGCVYGVEKLDKVLQKTMRKQIHAMENKR